MPNTPVDVPLAPHPFVSHSRAALDTFLDDGDHFAGSFCAAPTCGAHLSDRGAHTDARPLLTRTES